MGISRAEFFRHFPDAVVLEEQFTSTVNDYPRYVWDKGGWNRTAGRWYPTPSPEWQVHEYTLLMGRFPPANQDSWQWDYDPRRKASREAFARFINVHEVRS